MSRRSRKRAIDGNRDDRRPHPWRDEPDFVVPEFEPLGLGRISPAELSRHVLITGEVGSGKTDSAIRPLLRAIMQYPNSRELGTARTAALRPAVLLMDPKGDLTADARRENRRRRLGRRIIALDDGRSRVVHLFEGRDPGSLGTDEFMGRLLALAPSHQEERTHTNSAFFILQATLGFRALLAVDQHVARTRGVTGLRDFWAALAARVECALGSVPDGLRYERVAYLRPHATFVSLVASAREKVLDCYTSCCAAFGVPDAVLLPLAAWGTMRDETVAAIVATMHNFLQDLAGPLADRVSMNPFEPPPAGVAFSVRRALDAGWLVTLSPDPFDPVAVAAAVAVKGLYFAHAFTRRNKVRPFFYVADEAQMVLTTDSSAEHRFLDRCRAYRCGVILATQAVSSLQLRLNMLGDARMAAPALQILLTNTATKLWFRSTDPENRSIVRTLIPGPALLHKPHVVDVCPPSMLRTGECYLLGPHGWSRGRAAVAPANLASHVDPPTRRPNAKQPPPAPP